jgi:hypothetical protein
MQNIFRIAPGKLSRHQVNLQSQTVAELYGNRSGFVDEF